MINHRSKNNNKYQKKKLKTQQDRLTNPSTTQRLHAERTSVQLTVYSGSNIQNSLKFQYDGGAVNQTQMDNQGAYSQDDYNDCEWHINSGALSYKPPATSQVQFNEQKHGHICRRWLSGPTESAGPRRRYDSKHSQHNNLLHINFNNYNGSTN